MKMCLLAKHVSCCVFMRQNNAEDTFMQGQPQKLAKLFLMVIEIKPILPICALFFLEFLHGLCLLIYRIFIV